MANLFTDEKRNAADRRSVEERRGNLSDVAEDRRGDDRRDKRDRRSQIHGMEIKTRKSLIEMEEYLDDTCDDFWSAILLESNANTDFKRYRLQFFSLADKNRIAGDMPDSETL